MAGVTNFLGATQANGVVFSDIGTYPMTLQATVINPVNNLTINQSFTIEVSDPCKRAIL